jgi:hypothetical protein
VSGRCVAGCAARDPPASELREIEAILKSDDADGDVATVKEIATQTGLSVQTIRRRLRLRSLTPALRAAFDQGRITAQVAEAAARLPEREQQMLAAQLVERDRLTLSAVSEVARQRSNEAKADLPRELFSAARFPGRPSRAGTSSQPLAPFRRRLNE